MTKLNQPSQLVLTFPDIEGATEATVKYQTPSGVEGEWSTGVVVDTSAATVTYDIPANTLDEVGRWRFVAMVTILAKDYPSTTHVEQIYDVYAS